jgi:hypothetical protein
VPNPATEANKVVRTVIEAADPALQPVHKLRRFVVKRVEMAGGSIRKPSSARSGKPRSTK